MARPLRIEFPGALYHITTRGNARRAIFKSDSDRWRFLETLDDTVERHHWFVHAYCLMPNHYHLLVETPEGNLSTGMRRLNGVYTQKFNHRNKQVGHLFQGRFKAILVDRETYFLELCRYIVLNPVRAGLVDVPEDFAWSSYRAVLGLAPSPDCLVKETVLGYFGKHGRLAREAYQRFVRRGMGGKSPLEDVRGQCLLGGEAFVERHRSHFQGAGEDREISRVRKTFGRPPLEDLFSEADTRPRRHRAIVEAHLEHGYTQQAIAGHLGIHYSTVSRIVRKARDAPKTSKFKT
jgi:REP element-mobilizing transposase RayT